MPGYVLLSASDACSSDKSLGENFSPFPSDLHQFFRILNLSLIANYVAPILLHKGTFVSGPYLSRTSPNPVLS